MIDVNEIAKEAFDNMQVTDKYSRFQVSREVMSTTMAQNISANALCHNPVMEIATVCMSNEDKLVLMSAFIYFWEMGRLYGRQEIVDETMGGIDED